MTTRDDTIYLAREQLAAAGKALAEGRQVADASRRAVSKSRGVIQDLEQAERERQTGKGLP